MRVFVTFIIALSMAAASPAQPSLTERTIQPVPEGSVRHYLVAEPAGLTPGAAAVVILHGGTQSMHRILEPDQAPSRWLDIAESAGVLLIVPNGYNVSEMSGAGDQQTWNDIRPSDPNDGISDEDDVAFIEAVLDLEIPRYGVDPDAVFVTGSSNGGMMTYRLLVESPERFAAGAVFIASLTASDIPDPSAAVPVMIMNGDADPLMPWAGGPVGGGAPVRSTPETVDYWTRVHGAEAAGVTTLPDRAPSDGTRIVRAEFAVPGEPEPVVVLDRVIGGGHAIPMLESDMQQPLPVWLGRRSHDVRGVDEAWSFFQRHQPASIPADLDGDGAVGVGDLAQLLAAWGATSGSADLNGDGVVSTGDLAILLAAWG